MEGLNEKGRVRADKVLKEGSTDGRPTKYREEFNEQVYKLAILGLTDVELAKFFEVSESTFNLWKLEYPNFSESLRNGKDLADANVAVSLYERAVGYSHPEIVINAYQGEIIKTQVTKHYPPDTAAAALFLKNRQPKKWRDKQDVEHSGSVYSVNVTKEEAIQISKDLEDKY